MDEELSGRAEVIPLQRLRGSRRSDGPDPVDLDAHAGALTTSRRWLTRKEAADYMGIHPRTLANWAAAGRGPRYSKPSGSSCMYRLGDLDAYLQAHMVHTDDQPEAA
ncbi:helix-turn-helix transcriptional regulator [Nocardia xishanensis]